MTSKAQQSAIDNALVAQENQHVIGKCNMRINPRMKPKESTYQVVLDALALPTCYPAFLITTEVPIDNKDSKKQDKMLYPRFTKIIIHHFLEKDKFISMRNRTFMHTARDDSLLGTMRFVSRHEDAQIYGAILLKAMTNQAMLDFVAYKTYYEIALRAEPPKSKKPKTKSDSAISFKETPSKKKRTKAKKDVTSQKKPAPKPKPTKKKGPVEADRGKGLNVLSKVAIFEVTQLKEATKRSKKYFHISQASSSGDGTNFELGVLDKQQCKTSSADEGTGIKPGVPDVPKYLFESENKSWGDSDDDERNDDNSNEVTKNDDEDDVESDANDDNEASNSEKTDSDEDENLNLNLDDDEEEEKEEEDLRTPDSFKFKDDDEEYDELYKDVNVRSKITGHEEVGKGDAEMTDTTYESASQEKSYEQVIKDAHVSLTSSQKTEGSKQSSSSSSDFISKFLNLDNVPPALMKTINESLENVILAKSSSQPQLTYEAVASLTEFELNKILLDKLEKNKDEDPTAGPDQGLKKRKTSKDDDPSRGSKLKESKLSSSKGTKP
ncbi:hypothetical protein Tco_0434784 [Tanacetum coccineum]